MQAVGPIVSSVPIVAPYSLPEVFARGEIAPELISIKPGSLDDASWFKPEFDTWVCSKLDWLILDETLPKFEKLPPNFEP